MLLVRFIVKVGEGRGFSPAQEAGAPNCHLVQGATVFPLVRYLQNKIKQLSRWDDKLSEGRGFVFSPMLATVPTKNRQQ